jgi:primosomal protein N' (replication factor Y)
VAQVAGRAGRGDAPGRVVVQTTVPDHPAIRLAALHDYEAFAAAELEDRRARGYPPYRRLLRVVVRGPAEAAVARRAAETAERVRVLAGRRADVLGPAVPPVAKIQGLHRRHVLVKALAAADVARVLEGLKAAPRPGPKIEEMWDVDPVGVL